MKKIIIANNKMNMVAEEAKEYFLREFETMMDTLRPEKVYVYGKELAELESYGVDIEYISTFARKRFSKTD